MPRTGTTPALNSLRRKLPVVRWLGATLKVRNLRDRSRKKSWTMKQMITLRAGAMISSGRL